MITASFTDPQGTAHTDAVFYVRTANYTRNVSEYFELNSLDFTTTSNPPESDVSALNYSVYYWLNAAAKTSGAAPYILANATEMDMDFSFTPTAAYDGLTLEQKCEKHLTEVVLPPMQP